MKLARIVFLVAAVWGFLALTPLYFTFESFGRDNPPPVTHPELYYGFVGVALAWQVAFVVIATDPLRFRPLMPVAVLEKIGFPGAVAVLYVQGRIGVGPMLFGAVADLVLAVLFVTAFLRTRNRT